MKKIYWLYIIAAVVLISTLACQASIGNFGFRTRTVEGSGDVVLTERQVSDFDSVDMAGIGSLRIEVGDEEKLVIEAEDNFMEYIETEVRGDTLIISIQEKINLKLNEPIIYHLTVKELESISVSGLGNVDAPALTAKLFSVNISGAGDVDIESLDAEELEVHISGLGDLTIDDGKVNLQEVAVSGSGNHETRDMESTEAAIDISGVGSVTVRVTVHMKVDISGAGSVRYLGSPTIDSDVSGMGSLKKIGD